MPYTFLERLTFRAGALAGALVIRLLHRSCRVTVVGPRGAAAADPVALRPGDVPIYVAWHQRMFAYFEYLGRRHVAVMISRSRDGELVSRAAAHLGFRSIRGSSTRGGAKAQRELVRVLRNRRPVGFLADGPKGPARRAKPGSVAAAATTGDPIVPLSWNADRKWVLNSWDRYFIPKPFSRLVLYVGTPVRVSRGAGKAEREGARRRLEEALDRLCEEADAHFAEPSCKGPNARVAGPSGSVL